MGRFELIGVRVFNGAELNNTKYFEIGKMKDAIEYAKDKGSCGCRYDFICCDKYGNYICEL